MKIKHAEKEYVVVKNGDGSVDAIVHNSHVLFNADGCKFGVEGAVWKHVVLTFLGRGGKQYSRHFLANVKGKKVLGLLSFDTNNAKLDVVPKAQFQAFRQHVREALGLRGEGPALKELFLPILERERYEKTSFDVIGSKGSYVNVRFYVAGPHWGEVVYFVDEIRTADGTLLFKYDDEQDAGLHYRIRALGGDGSSISREPHVLVTSKEEDGREVVVNVQFIRKDKLHEPPHPPIFDGYLRCAQAVIDEEKGVEAVSAADILEDAAVELGVEVPHRVDVNSALAAALQQSLTGQPLH